MPRLRKPTAEQLERDCWKRTNRLVQAAMAEADCKTIRDLARITGLKEKTLYNRLDETAPWRLGEVQVVLFHLGADEALISKVFRRADA